MTGTALPAAGYFSNGARLNSEAKSGQDSMLAHTRQTAPGASTISTLTIASGAITPTAAVHAVDTESSAATDDLTNILVTNMTDGQFLVLSGVNVGRITTIKHGAGGLGQIFLQDDTEYALDDENTIILRLSGTSWYEVMRNATILDFYCGVAGGTANALTATTNMAIPALKTGMRFRITAASLSTSGTVTVAINGFSAKTIKQYLYSGKVLIGVGAIPAGGALDLMYDGTDLIWLNAPTYQHSADIASATTTVLNNATGDLIDITGTTTITAFTLAEGCEAVLRFTGALTLTNGASLIIPGGANITTAAGDFAVVRGYASGVVRVVSYHRLSFSALRSDIGAAASGVNTDITSLAAPTILGITSGASAPAGAVGEVIEASLNQGSATSLTTITAKTITSITLTAGKWRIDANALFNGGATTTVQMTCASISTSTNTFTPSEDRAIANFYNGEAVFNATNNPAAFIGGPLPTLEVNITSTTTYYLVSFAKFATSTMNGFGKLRGVRIQG